MMEKKRYTVKLNNVEKIEQLLQETYDLANRQTTQIQEEINKIANTTTINDLDIDGKEKYAKIMNGYISLQQKAIQQKFDVAKLMSEVLKHNGDVENTVNDTKAMSGMKMDINALRNAVKDMANTDKPNVYELKKP
jgi:hypothetical protein